MQRGVEAVRADHHQLDAVHERQRLVDGRGLVEQVLRPQAGVETGDLDVAGAHVGRLQVQRVHAQPALVEPVDGAEAVDRRHQAAVGAGPAQRVVRHHDLGQQQAAVALPAPRERHHQGLGGLGPVHASAGEYGDLVGIPQDSGAHGRVLSLASPEVRLAVVSRRRARLRGRCGGGAVCGLRPVRRAPPGGRIACAVVAGGGRRPRRRGPGAWRPARRLRGRRSRRACRALGVLGFWPAVGGRPAAVRSARRSGGRCGHRPRLVGVRTRRHRVRRWRRAGRRRSEATRRCHRRAGAKRLRCHRRVPRLASATRP